MEQGHFHAILANFKIAFKARCKKCKDGIMENTGRYNSFSVDFVGKKLKNDVPECYAIICR